MGGQVGVVRGMKGLPSPCLGRKRSRARSEEYDLEELTIACKV